MKIKTMKLNQLTKLPQKLRYHLIEAPKGRGLPVATEVIEQQYKDGSWSFLDSIDELANYMVVVGYVQHFAKNLSDAPRLLDIGCGHGNLTELLSGYSYKSYLGLDFSEEAVRRATSRNIKNAEFKVADTEKWMPEGKFDFILSTGSINYFKDPVDFLKRYSAVLEKDGKFIISLWRYAHHGVIWQNIEKEFEVLDATVVTNKKGNAWDVKVLQK